MRRFVVTIALASLGAHALPLDQCRQLTGPQIVARPEVQDQDGIGTCYANTAALLIQNALHLAAPVSYNALAIVNGVNSALPPSSESSGSSAGTTVPRTDLVEIPVGSFRQSFIGSEGGLICDTVNNASRIGFCSGASSGLDVRGSDQWQRQSQLLVAFGNVIDDLAKRKTRPTENEWAAYTAVLANRIQHKTSSCEGTPEQILQRKLEDMVPQKILDAIANSETILVSFDCQLRATPPPSASNRQQLLGDQARRIQIIAELRRLRDATLDFTPNPANPDVREWRLKASVARAYEALSPAYYKNLKDLAQTSGKPTDESFTQLMSALADPMPPLLQGAQTLAPAIDVRAMSDELQAQLRQGVADSYSAIQDCTAAVDISLALDVDPARFAGVEVCGGGGRTNPALAQAYEQAQRIVENLRGPAQTLPDRAATFLSIVAPQCTRELASFQAKPRPMTCDSFDLVPVEGSGAVKANGYQQQISQANSWIGERLCNGELVGVSLCTDFMDEFGSTDTNFCGTSSALKERSLHGFHAVTIIGQEFVPGGGVRYLVQNSWGGLCPFNDPKIRGTKDVVCEVVEGRTTGRFWIGSKLLLKNTYGLSGVRPAVASP